jgi:hypothetical protein
MEIRLQCFWLDNSKAGGLMRYLVPPTMSVEQIRLVPQDELSQTHACTGCGHRAHLSQEHITSVMPLTLERKQASDVCGLCRDDFCALFGLDPSTAVLVKVSHTLIYSYRNDTSTFFFILELWRLNRIRWGWSAHRQLDASRLTCSSLSSTCGSLTRRRRCNRRA